MLDALKAANIDAVIRDFGDKNPLEDPVIHFYELFLNDSNEILAVVDVNDPNIASGSDLALVCIAVDPLGVLLSETVRAKEGDILAGVSQPVLDIEFGTQGDAVTSRYHWRLDC